MIDHDDIPRQSTETDNKDYEAFPLDDAVRLAYVKRSSGAVEKWMVIGTSVQGGVEYTHVGRRGGEDYLEKEVPTDVLNAFDNEERAKRARSDQLGKLVVAMVQFDTESAHEPYIEPENERTLSSEKARALRRNYQQQQ